MPKIDLGEMIAANLNIDTNYSSFDNLAYHGDSKSLFLKSVEEEAENERISFSSKVFNKVEQFFDLGSTAQIGLDELSQEEKVSFLKIMAKLLQKGIVGYYYYEVDGKIEKHYIMNELGNRRLKDGKIIKNYIDRYV